MSTQTSPAPLEFPPMHDQRQPVIAMLLYPGLTLQDLLGPHTALSFSCQVHLVWKTTDPIVTDSGITIHPTMTIADCPKDVDAIFVPGGPGTIPMLSDPEILSFLADIGSRAKYVTSVCTGSLVLGAAGLMDGYKATCHWAYRDHLSLFGAIPVKARVVTDRNRVSGGGVTAGLDFGLVILATLLGEDVAKMTQLMIEYDPAPPFNSGTPETAEPAIIQKVGVVLAPLDMGMKQACIEASQGRKKQAA
jgi:cyclohexyl-isocyanide hydratase